MTAPESTEAKAATALEEAKELAERARQLIEWLKSHTIDGKPK